MEEFSKIHETGRRFCLSIVVQEVQMVIFGTLNLWFDGDFKLLHTAVWYLQFEGCFKSQLRSRLYPASRDFHVEIYPVSRDCCIAAYCFFLSSFKWLQQDVCADCRVPRICDVRVRVSVLSALFLLPIIFGMGEESVNSGATNNFLRGGKSE